MWGLVASCCKHGDEQDKTILLTLATIDFSALIHGVNYAVRLGSTTQASRFLGGYPEWQQKLHTQNEVHIYSVVELSLAPVFWI